MSKYKYDVSHYTDIETYSYEYFEADVATKLKLDGNFGKALGSINVKENDPKAAPSKDYDKGHYKPVDKEGLDVVASELILDSSAIQGIGSAAFTQATLLTDDHLTGGVAKAEALGSTSFAETTIDIDVSDDYVNVGGLSTSAADAHHVAGEVFADHHHYY